ncbi:pleckstrin homology domain-containing family M member 1 [Lepisosteus oculatus]|uniref:pleckstrin homology domain-containing family M member 1 n=1 Tax=Lepisosteus oculatus TaxID=7918 RepID=UPI0037156995
MISTHTPESGPEPKEVKQGLKTTLALSLKELQKRYVNSDAAVTSDDGDANVLCGALEAVFIHGIKTRHIRTEAGGRGKKAGSRAPLPQPVFWTLLKTITHRDVTTELEHLNFINTDVGRCRAWVRLALNDGLMECYLVSLLRERSKLCEYYQPAALLLDTEDREVLLTYLQGLTSLSFQLSYKSAMLNEWTVTPLVMAGLVPSSDSFDLLTSSNGDAKCKESWDSVSQSSGSDIIEVHHNSGQGLSQGRNSGKTKLTSSNLSLDTTGSSQLSSSQSSDSLPQVNGHKSPDTALEEQWSHAFDVISDEDPGKPVKEIIVDFSEGASSTPDPTREDSYASSQPPDHSLSETAESSSTDSEAASPVSPAAPPVEAEPTVAPPPEPRPENAGRGAPGPTQPPASARAPEFPVLKQEKKRRLKLKTPLPEPHACVSEERRPEATPRTPESSPSRKESVDCLYSPTTGLPKYPSWISEDDFYKPCPEETPKTKDVLGFIDSHENGGGSVGAEPEWAPPSVVHRKGTGLTNLFRGLLKLGNLERRRGPVGMWREYYCELSPYEFRLYPDEEERSCCENCSLLRCESVRAPSSDGRFELHFTGKRLYLRAPSQGEAEDWVDMVWEAVNKCRPAQPDDQWEILPDPVGRGEVGSGPPSSASSPPAEQPGQGGSPPPLLSWTRHTEPEQDAIKETVLYLLADKTWAPYVFSLSLEALKCFRVQDQKKILHSTQQIESIRDVVPDTTLGSPAFFKVLTTKATLKLRAENEEEARSWRELIRGALNCYLETSEVTAAGDSAGSTIHRLVQHSLKGNGVLLPYLCTVPTEKGLDVQNFRCAGCSRQIGFSFGRPRLCEYSGMYYCDGCHRGDVSVIPSRIIHNWDLSLREVSRKALRFLSQIAHEPLIDVELLNPSLYDHVEQLKQTLSSRQKLRLLGEYLITCRSGGMKKMQAQLDQRNYILESAHLYSVADLQQMVEGQYEAFLQSIIQFASNHVYHCDLCTQRGFICQICNHSDIIFPFEFESTTRCQKCKTVFHSTCKKQNPACPRCQRLQKYLERELQD